VPKIRKSIIFSCQHLLKHTKIAINPYYYYYYYYLNTTFMIKPPLSSCIKSGTAAMEKQVFEYGLMLASANPNSGTVGPSPMEKKFVSGTQCGGFQFIVILTP